MANAIAMNKLRNGVIAGFRLTEIKSFDFDVEVQNNASGLLEVVKWKKLQVKLSHDASQPMSEKNPYAVASIDPSRPLILTLHTFLVPRPAVDGKPQLPVAAEKAPSSDRMRWAFVKYDTFQKILHFAGYIPKSKPPQKLPLPGVVYIELALSNGNNYPRKIGGPDIIEEKKREMEEMNDSLDAIFEMSATDGDGEDDALGALPDTGESESAGEGSNPGKEG